MQLGSRWPIGEEPPARISDELRASRLRLADITANTLGRGLDLLGIDVMEKM